MIVKMVWTANAYRNFNYLIACPQTSTPLAIDPLDRKQELSLICFCAGMIEIWRLKRGSEGRTKPQSAARGDPKIYNAYGS